MTKTVTTKPGFVNIKQLRQIIVIETLEDYYFHTGRRNLANNMTIQPPVQLPLMAD